MDAIAVDVVYAFELGNLEYYPEDLQQTCRDEYRTNGARSDKKNYGSEAEAITAAGDFVQAFLTINPHIKSVEYHIRTIRRAFRQNEG